MAAKAEQPITAPRRGEFRAQSEHVEKLAAKLDQAGDPEVRPPHWSWCTVVELHGAALQRLIDKCLETAEGEHVLSAALEDNLVAGMFLLHSLHPDDIETRVVRGLDSVRPYLKSHGGDCELVSVRDGIVRLKLHGTCGSCPSFSLTLKTAVEEALYKPLQIFWKLWRRMPPLKIFPLPTSSFSNKRRDTMPYQDTTREGQAIVQGPPEARL